MEGKRILVTGSSAGIGLIIATALAEMGAEVIHVSRNKNKCQQVMEKIQEDTGYPKISYDKEIARQLWEVSTDLSGLS